MYKLKIIHKTSTSLQDWLHTTLHQCLDCTATTSQYTCQVPWTRPHGVDPTRQVPQWLRWRLFWEHLLWSQNIASVHLELQLSWPEDERRWYKPYFVMKESEETWRNCEVPTRSHRIYHLQNPWHISFHLVPMPCCPGFEVVQISEIQTSTDLFVQFFCI